MLNEKRFKLGKGLYQEIKLTWAVAILSFLQRGCQRTKGLVDIEQIKCLKNCRNLDFRHVLGSKDPTYPITV